MELQQQNLTNKSKDNNNNKNKRRKVIYYAKISRMGDKKMVIIPKTFWDDIKDLEQEKQIKITLESIE